MDHIPPFNPQQLTAIAKVLGDTTKGLTGTEIGYYLSDCKILDVTPDMTKWKRIFNAFVEFLWQRGSHFGLEEESSTPSSPGRTAFSPKSMVSL
jgi:hypothetical protein